MEKAKTKFTAAGMLDSMLAASAAPTQPKEAARPAKREAKAARKEAPVPEAKRPGVVTTVELAPDVYMAMTIRKAQAERGGDRSFVKILDNALRAYLAEELKACAALNN